jgi:starvation-inducible DNA-binding protein
MSLKSRPDANGRGERDTDGADALRLARPHFNQHATELQPYGTTLRYPIALDEKIRAESISILNQLLADTMTLRDLYKKHHWQVSGATFHQLHLSTPRLRVSGRPVGNLSCQRGSGMEGRHAA